MSIGDKLSLSSPLNLQLFMFFTYLASWPVSLAEVHGKHGGRATFEENGDNNYFAASVDVDVDVDVGDHDDDNELTTITMLMNTCYTVIIILKTFQQRVASIM